MAKIRRPRLFSDEFGLSRRALRKVGVLNPVLNLDTRLFIDPLLLEKSAHTEISGGARTRYKKFFTDLAKLLGASKTQGDVAWRNAYRFMDFGEIRGTCLGYGANSIAGSAFGPALTEQVLGVAKAIVDLGVTDPDFFALLALFEDGIGPDRISDMTTNVILPDLLAFNSRILAALGVPTERFILKNQPAFLARNPLQRSKTPLILVPLDVLKPLPVALDWDGVASAASHNAHLRARVSSDVGAIWQAKTAKERAEIRARVLSSKTAALTMLEAIKAAETPAYDADVDPQGLLRWLDVARAVTEENPLTLTAPKTLSFGDVRKIVATIVERFQMLIEQKGLAKELWQGGKSRGEKSAQRLFFAIADTYCSANNLDITPEADSGGGPVDFKFSAGYNERVLVEVKLSSNSKLVHGFTTQLEVYKAAEQTTRATYLVIDVGGMGKKDEALVKLRNERTAKGRPVSDLVFVDGSVKASASKRE